MLDGRYLNKGIFLRFLSSLAPHFLTPSTMRRFLGLNFPIQKRVSIIGGQFPVCTLALSLAQKGKKVHLIEESETFGADLEDYTKVALNDEIQDGNIKVLTSMKIEEITPEGVVLQDKNGNKLLRKAEIVIEALGLQPRVLF